MPNSHIIIACTDFESVIATRHIIATGSIVIQGGFTLSSIVVAGQVVKQ